MVPRFYLFLFFKFCLNYSKIMKFTLLVSNNIFKAMLALVFVMKSAKLLSCFIYLLFVVFYHLYNWQRLTILIISRLSLIMPSLTKNLYNNFELIQMTIKILYWTIWKSFAFHMTPMSKPWAIAYSFKANTLFMTYLHLIKS